MGSSFTKQGNEHQGEEIPFGDGSPWLFAEVLYESFLELTVQVNGLEQELMLLKNNPHFQNPSPKPMTEACCQTRYQSAMEIELLKQARQGARSGAPLSRRRSFIPKCIRENTSEERKWR